ncbi:MAG: MotA/TolQ/ExbB proton channel family protein [Pseudomonadota bacterium]|nr:MotA/TolQ/ExbB proton channel family protein [Pseudomonadota bacterium]
MKQRKFLKPVLKWWLIFCSVIFATIYSHMTMNLFVSLNDADVTKLSFAVIGAFYIYMITFGVHLSKFCKNIFNQKMKERFLKIEEHGWFISDIFMAVGFLGTLIGFIYMLDLTGFSSGTDSSATLVTLATGMKTALYTTVMALISSIIIKITLYTVRNDLEKIDGCSLKQIGEDDV